MGSIGAVFLTYLSCTACGLRHEWSQLQNLCNSCGKPLFAQYDLEAIARTWKPEALKTREKSLWRYREVLPLPFEIEPVSLGEGGTPLLRADRFGKDLRNFRSLGKGRSAESNPEFQGARHGRGGFDGETPGRKQTGCALPLATPEAPWPPMPPAPDSRRTSSCLTTRRERT